MPTNPPTERDMEEARKVWDVLPKAFCTKETAVIVIATALAARERAGEDRTLSDPSLVVRISSNVSRLYIDAGENGVPFDDLVACIASSLKSSAKEAGNGYAR